MDKFYYALISVTLVMCSIMALGMGVVTGIWWSGLVADGFAIVAFGAGYIALSKYSSVIEELEEKATRTI